MRVNDYIERGHTVVCANVRLAHRLKHLYAQEQLRQGRRAWETPDILPYRAWLRRCWNSRHERNGVTKLMLSGDQESVVWQQIIKDSDYKDNLLQISSVAEQVVGAWQRLKEYNVPIFPEGTPMNDDVFAFKSWADEFQSRCRHNNWIDNASLADILRLDAATVPDTFGHGVTLAGFDQLTPQQTMLYKGMKTAGIPVDECPIEDRNISVQVTDFADTDQEIRAAAGWARRLIEENGETTIGILAPDLRKLRNRIRYIFEDILTPGNLSYREATAPLPFSISMGQPLADYPLIHVIFSILGLSKASLALETLGILLRTPFIKGHDRERAGRALLDEKLRTRKQLTFTLTDVLYFTDATGDKGQPIPIMASILREAGSALEELPARQSPEAWTESFTFFLELFGWPGEHTLDSAEYQQVQSWHSVLDSFVSLRVVSPVMTRFEALSHIRRIAMGLGFQPETAETPVQILDPHGVAALALDHVWMLGLSEETWPPRPIPNPFIPIALQKKYGIPGADADNALQQAERLQTALVGSTPNIILSHSRNEGDRPLLRSPLLRDLPTLADETVQGLTEAANAVGRPTPVDESKQMTEIKPYSQVIFENGTMETFVDTTAPPITGLYADGGADLFRDQSQCPFRAFARHRLHSRELAEADIGLDAAQRGTLLHQLMEKIWSQLESRDKLATMTVEEREQLIESRVHELITDSRRYNPLIFTERFCAIETRRLAQVLREWLELELQRAPFTVVNVERKARYAIADVEFSARLDRVDSLEDGRRVIIDYKSGKANVNAWATDRPDEPQMPLYAVTHPGVVTAVAFARLKRGGDFGFAGLAETGDILPGTKAFEQDRQAKRFIPEREAGPAETSPSWEDLFDNWRAVLQDLATEFRQGVATVTPKHGACDHCDQQPLCRIHEIRGQSKNT